MPKTIHFLHIGKTGGSAVKEALKRGIKEQDIYSKTKKLKDNTLLEIKDLSEQYDQIILHGHGTTLKEIPESDWFFFCIRDPLSRFVSGFYSRQRQGKPRYNIPWNAKEERAFRHFETANDLAEALSSSSPSVRNRAEQAMQNIRHVKTSISKWIIDPTYFEKRKENLLYILEQRTLEKDFEKMLLKIHYNRQLNLSNDEKITHRANPSKTNTTLSELALQNLNNYYAKDIKIYNYLTELKLKL